MTRKTIILDTVDDLVTALLWDDREEDEDLPRGQIEDAIDTGEITLDEILIRFRTALTRGVNHGR